MAVYKNELLPVVGLAGRLPQVEFQGKLKKLPSKQTYMPLRASSYAEGFVTISDQRASSHKTNLVYMFSTGGEVSGGTIRASSSYSATLNSTVALKNCYLAVFFYELPLPQGAHEVPKASIFFFPVGDIPADKPTKVSADFGFLDGAKRQLSYFPLIFTRGHEVRSTLSDSVAGFFNRFEMRLHHNLVAAYVEQNAGKSKPMAVYTQIAPVIDEDVDRSTLPAEVKVTFMVTTEGTVEGLIFGERLDPLVERAVRRAVQGWLFYPRLIDGYPERTMTSLKLSFDKARESAP